MTNDINFWTGIKDSYLKLDKPFLTESKELKIIHLIQSYLMHCPLCGQLMCRNGFRKRPVTIKILTLAGKPAVLKIKKQQYLCPPSPQCPKVAEIQRVNFACRIANVVKYHIATPCRCKAQFFLLWLRSRFLVFPIFPNIRICRYVGKKV